MLLSAATRLYMLRILIPPYVHSTMYFSFPCGKKTGIKIVDGKRRKLRRVMWEHHVVFFIKILVKYVQDGILRYFLYYYTTAVQG